MSCGRLFPSVMRGRASLAWRMTPHPRRTNRVGTRGAITTGTPVVPPHKVARGYRYEADKFGISGLTPLASTRVAAPRVKEFPVHMEAELEQSWAMAPKGQPQMAAASPLAFHMRIVQVHVEENLVMAGHGNRVDPDQWRPLIMSFQQFYKLGPRAGASTL